MSDATKPYTEFVVPASVASKADVSRLVNEAERVDAELTALAVHNKVGAKTIEVPVMSPQLEEFLRLNKLTVTDSRERTELIKQLRLFKQKTPIIHMTFAVMADHDSLQQIVTWLRGSVHPQAVLEVGLQPALVAGVSVRTPNHIHDFSIRAALARHRPQLVEEIGKLRGN